MRTEFSFPTNTIKHDQRNLTKNKEAESRRGSRVIGVPFHVALPNNPPLSMTRSRTRYRARWNNRHIAVYSTHRDFYAEAKRVSWRTLTTNDEFYRRDLCDRSRVFDESADTAVDEASGRASKWLLLRPALGRVNPVTSANSRNRVERARPRIGNFPERGKQCAARLPIAPFGSYPPSFFCASARIGLG